MTKRTERKVAAARDLRQRQTPAETHLWSALRRNQLGVPFRRQHVIGPFIVDFCCLPVRLVIEVDGDVHERDDVRGQDAWRTEYLVSRGFTIMRCTNRDVLTHLDVVLGDIRLALRELS